MKKIFFILSLFIFNILHVDSNSNKNLFYSQDDIYDEKVYEMYFVSLNTNNLEKIINDLDIEVYSYIIDDEKYYARNINKFKEIYLKDKSSNEKIYYEEYGINIDGITCLCNGNQISKLKELVSIY